MSLSAADPEAVGNNWQILQSIAVEQLCLLKTYFETRAKEAENCNEQMRQHALAALGKNEMPSTNISLETELNNWTTFETISKYMDSHFRFVLDFEDYVCAT